MIGNDLSLLLVGRDTPQELRELVALADQSGYDGLWLADERFFRDCWAGLTVAALTSSTLRLGVCVTDPYVRHPALTATAFATVDEVSEGRAVLGLGAGISGFAEMGINRNKPLTAIRETIELVRQLWSGDHIEYAGETVQFHGGVINVPARLDAPICIASNGTRIIQLAGEVADGLIVQALASTEMVSSVMELLATGAARSQRDPAQLRLHSRLDVALHSDPRIAREAVLPGVVRHLRTHYPLYSSPKLAGLTIPDSLNEAMSQLSYTHDPDALAAVAPLIPEHFIDRLAAAGTVDDVARQFGRLLANGVAEIIVMPVLSEGQQQRDLIEQIAQEVMPRAREYAHALAAQTA